jgi:hypothetical protein
VNELDTSCEWDGHELYTPRIQAHAQLRIALKVCSQVGASSKWVLNGQGWLRVWPQETYVGTPDRY